MSALPIDTDLKKEVTDSHEKVDVAMVSNSKKKVDNLKNEA